MKLLQGDCLELMREIPDKSIDMILCDLPYGTTNNKWDIIIPFAPLWEQYKRIIKEHGAIVLFSQQPFTTDLIYSNKKMFRYEWIWRKSRATGFLNANRMPLKSHENILVFYEKLPVYNPQKTIGKKCYKFFSKKTSSNYSKYKSIETLNTDGSRYPVDVIKFPSCNTNKEKQTHPTKKPVNLLEYLIKTYTNENDIVLDNCMGSGSTGVACANTGRGFIGIELNKTYFEIAKSRISEALKAKELITCQ